MRIPTLPDLSRRRDLREWMDDFSRSDDRLRAALQDLRRVNRMLGGYRTSSTVLTPLLRRRSALSLLDLGTGSGDYLVDLVRRGSDRGCEVSAVGVDLNPVTVGHGRAHLDACLSSPHRSRTRVEIGDALDLPYADDAFDVAHAALFLHHFHGDDPVQLLREMNRVSRIGIVVNDLHRHTVAYVGIWVLSRLLRMAPMVQHDGPISVRRGFHQSELVTLARRAGLLAPRIRWHWAFRWTLSTIPGGD